jgi:hypothetical protein
MDFSAISIDTTYLLAAGGAVLAYIVGKAAITSGITMFKQMIGRG